MRLHLLRLLTNAKMPEGFLAWLDLEPITLSVEWCREMRRRGV